MGCHCFLWEQSITVAKPALLLATAGRLRGQIVPAELSGHPELPPALLLPQQQAAPRPGRCGAGEGGPAAPACLPAPALQAAPSWRSR